VASLISMIVRTATSRRAAPTPTRGPERRRRRPAWAVVLVLAALLVAAVALLPLVARGNSGTGRAGSSAPSAGPAPTVVPTDTAGPSTAASSAAGPSAAVRPPPVAPDLSTVLSLPGRVPSTGSGKMTFARGTGRLLGVLGPVHRFRVAVERGSGEDVDAFAAQVDATLGDKRSWTGDGLRMQRVPETADSEFTVYLATRDSAQKICRAGGVDLTVGRVPYTSCRTTGHVVLNLDRWRSSAGPYVAARVPLATYRQYLVNHEVGHQLGHHHEGCPGAGGPAPVMVQQTLTLRGCTPYPWPRRDGHRYVGPGL
jgi:hypothetical protein